MTNKITKDKPKAVKGLIIAVNSKIFFCYFLIEGTSEGNQIHNNQLNKKQLFLSPKKNYVEKSSLKNKSNTAKII